MNQTALQPAKRPQDIFLVHFGEHEATISINGIRYRYSFMTKQEVSTLEYLFRKVSALKGLNYAKVHAEKVERV